VANSKKPRTKTGRALTDGEVDAVSREVETTQYDVGSLKERRRGRPSMGSRAADVVQGRLDPELRATIEEEAGATHSTASEVIRRAIRRYLHVA
jgi:hypothetical protein